MPKSSKNGQFAKIADQRHHRALFANSKAKHFLVARITRPILNGDNIMARSDQLNVSLSPDATIQEYVQKRLDRYDSCATNAGSTRSHPTTRRA